HVAGRQRQLGEVFQPLGAEAGLFLELAVGGVEHFLAGLDQPLGQRQLVIVGAGAILLHQQRVLGVGHGHHHHRAVASLADQALVGALHAVAEAQLQLLDGEQSAARDDLARQHGGFLSHGILRNRLAGIITAFSRRTAPQIRTAWSSQCPSRPGRPSTPCCWTWTAPCWTCTSTTTSGWSTCRNATPSTGASVGPRPTGSWCRCSRATPAGSTGTAWISGVGNSTCQSSNSSARSPT